MNKPKEIWVFSNFDLEVFGPCTVIGESNEHTCWKYKHNHSNYACFVPKNQVILTRKQAVEACYRYHEKAIKQEQKKLDERKRLLKKFYSEELYDG